MNTYCSMMGHTEKYPGRNLKNIRDPCFKGSHKKQNI